MLLVEKYIIVLYIVYYRSLNIKWKVVIKTKRKPRAYIILLCIHVWLKIQQHDTCQNRFSYTQNTRAYIYIYIK